MGLFGFVGNLASSAIKIAATPITACVDVASVVTGNEATLTKSTLQSSGKDLKKSIDELLP